MDSNFGRLGPLKLEFHASDPLIVVVHDALGDKLLEEVSTLVEAKELEAPKSVSG